ncbi:uncharacterized protein LOC129315887 [Prosopis cineraria]|uniref:uncharacterized protein LOC129315887 n=1 Tax=Prosopis cineraria TaxID=364024 RepID=UPI00240FDA93|nr:uncharacterized protein LOC129315887 [Prosopis cineraria]
MVQHLPKGSISSWEDLENKFRARFFFDDKTVEVRDEFLSFKQYPDEHLYATWERYKMLMKKCPNHGVDKWVVIQIFCNHLNLSSKAMVDSITNKRYQNVPVNEVFCLLDQLSVNNTQNMDRRNTLIMTSAKDNSSSQIVSILNAMNKCFDMLEFQMQRGNSYNVHAVQAIPTICNQCNDVHLPNQYPLYMTPESVNYMGNSSNQPSSSNIKPIHPPSFQAPPKPMPVKEEESRMEKMLAQILSNQESTRVETKATLTLHDTTIKNLEVQMGQLASQINAMSRSNLPSDTIPSPKRDGKEECKAITLRSGMQLPKVLISSASGMSSSATKVVVDNEVINKEIVVKKCDNSKNNQEKKKNEDQAKKVGDEKKQ